MWATQWLFTLRLEAVKSKITDQHTNNNVPLENGIYRSKQCTADDIDRLCPWVYGLDSVNVTSELLWRRSTKSLIIFY